MLAIRDEAGGKTVIVLPVTHTPPRDPALVVDIPASTKRRLDLDELRSWIVLSEANRFKWPGPDLRPMTSGDASTILYGVLPSDLFQAVREKWLQLSAARRAIVTRTE